MTDDLCCCSFWTGRVAVHHQRDGCTPETQPTPDSFVAEVAVAAVAAAQPLMTALVDSFGRISRTLDAAWKVAQQEQQKP